MWLCRALSSTSSSVLQCFGQAHKVHETIIFLLVTRTHTHLTALFPGLPRWAGTRKAKPIWVLLKQETVSGSGISWNICKSAPRSRQITTPAPHHSVYFTGRMPFLPPNQQRQSTEGIPRSIFSVHLLACNFAKYSPIKKKLLADSAIHFSYFGYRQTPTTH